MFLKSFPLLLLSQLVCGQTITLSSVTTTTASPSTTLLSDILYDCVTPGALAEPTSIYLTRYTTSFLDVCATGTYMQTYTITASCPDGYDSFTKPTTAPPGYTVTTKVCTGDCPTADAGVVTVTQPCGCTLEGAAATMPPVAGALGLSVPASTGGNGASSAIAASVIASNGAVATPSAGSSQRGSGNSGSTIQPLISNDAARLGVQDISMVHLMLSSMGIVTVLMFVL